MGGELAPMVLRAEYASDSTLAVRHSWPLTRASLRPFLANRRTRFLESASLRPGAVNGQTRCPAK